MSKRSVRRTRPAGSHPFSVIRQVAPKPEAPIVPAVELERAEGEGMPSPSPEFRPWREVMAEIDADEALADALDQPTCHCGQLLSTHDMSHTPRELPDDSEAVMTAPVSQFGANELAANANYREPNFRDKEGKFQLVKCFYCRPEGRGNLAQGTARGICNWCGARGK